MKMMKKGISPLIATVLIIGFTVALAAIIMTWGTTFSKGIQKSTEATSDERMACAQDVQISLASACVFDPTHIKMTIKNDGSKAIVNLTARFYSGASAVTSKSLNDADVIPVGAPIAPYGIATPSVPITVVASTIKYVEIIPAIKVGEKLVTCAEAVENFGDSTYIELLDAC